MSHCPRRGLPPSALQSRALLREDGKKRGWMNARGSEQEKLVVVILASVASSLIYLIELHFISVNLNCNVCVCVLS